MAHTAFTVVDVLPITDDKITSLTYYGWCEHLPLYEPPP